MGIGFFREVAHMMWILREQMNRINLEHSRLHTQDIKFYMIH